MQALSIDIDRTRLGRKYITSYVYFMAAATRPPDDLLAREGGVMLGSRLKRLAERLQAGAELIARDCGLPTRPGQMPLLTALWRHGSLGVGEAAGLTGFSQPALTRVARQLERTGLVAARGEPADRRTLKLSLTAEGKEVMATAQTSLWPLFRAAVA